MYLKSRIGQRRIRHSEIVAWHETVSNLGSYSSARAVLQYWGRYAWTMPAPRCVFARRRARDDRAWAELHARLRALES